LVARVSRLESVANGQLPSPDLGQGLVAAGLASWLPNCSS